MCLKIPTGEKLYTATMDFNSKEEYEEQLKENRSTKEYDTYLDCYGTTHSFRKKLIAYIESYTVGL